ncbi:phasin family protein [Cupriavidus sp. CuC1]|uniref:phasin family protein n=1 Tax=Cupriavidus sp. CuC1 TaxID=3373131 RepID=UPI0037D7E7AD
MTDQTDVPLALFTANCEAGLRVLTLMQESRQRFLELQLDAVRKDIEILHEAGAQLANAGDFSTLSTLPATFLRSQAEHYAQRMQAWMSLTIHNQTAMVEQLREAGETWQRCQAATLQQAGSTASLPAPVRDMFEKLSQGAATLNASASGTGAATQKRTIHTG